MRKHDLRMIESKAAAGLGLSVVSPYGQVLTFCMVLKKPESLRHPTISTSGFGLIRTMKLLVLMVLSHLVLLSFGLGFRPPPRRIEAEMENDFSAPK